jgi:hypothetical protein
MAMKGCVIMNKKKKAVVTPRVSNPQWTAEAIFASIDPHEAMASSRAARERRRALGQQPYTPTMIQMAACEASCHILDAIDSLQDWSLKVCEPKRKSFETRAMLAMRLRNLADILDQLETRVA